jgi:hypothetical protein
MSNELSGDSLFVGAWSENLNGKQAIEETKESTSTKAEKPDDSPEAITTMDASAKTDVKQSLLLLHNSRRRKHGSASPIIVNTQKIQKFLEDTVDEEDAHNFEKEKEKEKVTPCQVDNEIGIRRPQLQLSKAATKIQRYWRKRHDSKIVQKRKIKCAQGGRWTKLQNDRVISLLLGWRVRFLMRSKRIVKGVHALNDVYKVLTEVISTTTPSSPSNSPGAAAASSTQVDSKDYANRNRMFDVICQLSGNQTKRDRRTSGIDINIPYTDRVLVSHLIKEALLLRAAFRRALFEDVVWRPFQTNFNSNHFRKEHLEGQSQEGYWDFSASIAAIFNAAAVNDYPLSSGFGSPKRKQNTNFPSASRSSSFRITQQEQQQQQQHDFSGDDSDDSLNHKKNASHHASPPPAGSTGDLNRTQPVVRRASVPFQEFPQPPDAPKGEDKLGISLSETGDSVIQAQLASLRLQAMRKKLGVTPEVEDNGGDEVKDKDKDRDRGVRLKGSGGAVARRIPGVSSKASASTHAAAGAAAGAKSSYIEPVRPEGCRACIQLTVLHADRLMPAKKVRPSPPSVCTLNSIHTCPTHSSAVSKLCF